MRQQNKDFPLVNEWGLQANANQAKSYFGLDYNDRWPAEGIEPRTINGFVFYVKPLLPLAQRTTHTGVYPRIKNPLRFMVVCPHCDKHFTYGRLHQHLVVHPEISK